MRRCREAVPHVCQGVTFILGRRCPGFLERQPQENRGPDRWSAGPGSRCQERGPVCAAHFAMVTPALASQEPVWGGSGKR